MSKSKARGAGRLRIEVDARIPRTPNATGRGVASRLVALSNGTAAVGWQRDGTQIYSTVLLIKRLLKQFSMSVKA